MERVTGAARRVARDLLDHGPATAAVLADRLGLTPAAVRRHLDALVVAGLVAAGRRAPFGPAPVRGRGRPARVYALTSGGRDAFHQAYDGLALDVLRHLDASGGPGAVADFARARVARMEQRLAPRLEGVADPADRAGVLAEVLCAEGFAASAVPAAPPAAGVQVCQRHCPIAHAAAEFPQLCEAEAQAFGRLVGARVIRLSTIAAGAGVCTTHVLVATPAEPAVPASSARGPLPSAAVPAPPPGASVPPVPTPAARTS